MYLLLMFLITLSGFTLGMQDTNRKKILRFVIFSFCCIGVLIAFRGANVGADTISYMRWFARAQSSLDASTFPLEKGSYYLFVALGFISKNPQIIFLFEAIVVGLCYGFFIYKHVTSIFEAYICILSYLGFQLFAFNLTGYRQSIALCICVVAYKFIEEKKPIKFLLMVAFASFFHSSSWFFVVAYIISLVGTNWGKIVMFVFTIYASRNLNMIFSAVSIIDEKYEKYGIEETGNGLVFLGVLLIVLFFVEFGMKKYKGSQPIDKLVNIHYFCIGLWCLRLITRVAERPALYFLPATMILTSYIPQMYSNIFDRKSNQILRVGICVSLIILFLIRSSRMPYSFCW